MKTTAFARLAALDLFVPCAAAAPDPATIESQFTLPAGFAIRLVAAEPDPAKFGNWRRIRRRQRGLDAHADEHARRRRDDVPCAQTFGRAFSGLVEAAGKNVVIQTLGTAPVRVPQAEVKLRTASQLSPMPEGLEAPMTVAEPADLTAYLLSLKGGN